MITWIRVSLANCCKRIIQFYRLSEGRRVDISREPPKKISITSSRVLWGITPGPYLEVLISPFYLLSAPGICVISTIVNPAFFRLPKGWRDGRNDWLDVQWWSLLWYDAAVFSCRGDRHKIESSCTFNISLAYMSRSSRFCRKKSYYIYLLIMEVYAVR